MSKPVVIKNKDYIASNRSELLNIGEFFIEPRANVHRHTHNYFEINYIKNGKGIYWVNSDEYTAESGDIFIFNNNDIHGLSVNPPDHLVNLVIHFDPKFICSLEGNCFDTDLLKVFYKRDNHFSHKLDYSNTAIKMIQQLICEIENEFKSKNVEYPLMVKLKLLSVLALISRYFIKSDHSIDDTSLQRKHLSTLKSILNYIESNYHREIKLQELASIAKYNPSYLSALFKKIFGITISDYLIKYRINEAKKRLITTNKSITEIAAMCGFNNSTNFNKAFKKITNDTPSNYRNNSR